MVFFFFAMHAKIGFPYLADRYFQEFLFTTELEHLANIYGSFSKKCAK